MARNKYDVDEVLEDKFDLNQLKRLLAYLIPYRKRFVSVGFMMLSASAFTMLIPQFFQKVMDVCIPNKDMNGIAFYSFLTLLAAFYSAFSLRYKIKYTNQIGQQIIHDMRYDIFEHLLGGIGVLDLVFAHAAAQFIHNGGCRLHAAVGHEQNIFEFLIEILVNLPCFLHQRIDTPHQRITRLG